ncbi:unnamed protein product [Prorocentrum cordatum]|uniref:Uncharacterized protein n=1 Tax=Prorocentrum cordatum TaxID=2364126 RepID=A0ABN9TXM2_9DINO|nr:unnamed protein product [Polarella glacialis]
MATRKVTRAALEQQPASSGDPGEPSGRRVSSSSMSAHARAGQAGRHGTTGSGNSAGADCARPRAPRHCAATQPDSAEGWRSHGEAEPAVAGAITVQSSSGRRELGYAAELEVLVLPEPRARNRT